MKDTLSNQISCAVVISSCDAYSDLWVPFFSLFWKYWPDCTFPVYLVGNHQKFLDEKIVSLNIVGDFLNWSQMLHKALSGLDTEYVLLMLEDFFLRRRIQTQQILVILKFLDQLDGQMLRLVPRPPPDDRITDFPLIGRIRPGAPYRVSSQGAFWRRKTLIDLLRDGESIWEFELKGSRRSDILEGFYSTWKPVLTYDHHVIERGKWFRNEASRFGRMGTNCDFSRRPIMTRMEMVRWRISMIKGWFLQRIPWPQRVRLVNFIKRALGR
jgi:hypothetical protein